MVKSLLSQFKLPFEDLPRVNPVTGIDEPKEFKWGKFVRIGSIARKNRRDKRLKELKPVEE